MRVVVNIMSQLSIEALVFNLFKKIKPRMGAGGRGVAGWRLPPPALAPPCLRHPPPPPLSHPRAAAFLPSKEEREDGSAAATLK